MALKRSSLKRVFSAAFQTRSFSAPVDRAIPLNKQKYVPSEGTYPKGFQAGSSHAGVKPSNKDHDDVAMIASDALCAAAGIFTRNHFKAAPVRLCQELLKQRSEGPGFRGVVVNSGCANAVTGTVGMEHARSMAEVSDRCFQALDGTTSPPSTLVMSTGVIGQHLPMDKLKYAIPKACSSLGSSHGSWMKAAKAICTTDTFPKLRSRAFRLPSHPNTEYRIAGMTKGAGMIHPNMATLLAIVCTDVNIRQDALHEYLSRASEHSFNSISVDGDTSTNDTCLLFANGAGGPPGSKALGRPPQTGVYESDESAFLKVLSEFMLDLAKLVVHDGEGATKFVTIRVRTDKGRAFAKQAANSIGKSPLVKTALYGKDANWGRIMCALGYAPDMLDDDAAFPTVAYGETKSSTSVTFVPADGKQGDEAARARRASRAR